MYFLFGTLWSVLFWVVYFVLSLLVTAILLKIPHDKNAFNYITKKSEFYKEECQVDRPYMKEETDLYIFQTVVYLLLWPIILPIFLAYFTIWKSIWPSIRKAVTAMSDLIPSVEFKK